MYRALILKGLAAAFTIAASSAGAAAIIIPEGLTNSSGGTVTVTDSISFSITSSSSAALIVFDDWVTSDDTPTSLYPTGATVQYQIDGGGVQGTTFSFFKDNITGNIQDLTADDGYIYISPISVTAGQTLTILAQSWSMSGSSQFNPEAVGTFTGDLFLTNSSGQRVSDIVTAVPEPSTWAAFAGVGALGFVMARRRRRA